MGHKGGKVSGVKILTATLVFLLAAGGPLNAFAFRPFDSTDAGVVQPGELEIEWGTLTLEHQSGDTAYILPDLVFNVGVSPRTEIIGEFVVERTPEDQWEVGDAGAFVKTVWSEGVLQGKTGVSLATEAGLLMPGTPADQEGVGVEGIAIASVRFSSLTVHFNAGGGVTRDDADPFALGGIIAEYPLRENLQLVSEINGEVVLGKDQDEASWLVGVIWSPSHITGDLDLGIRRGLTSEASDWSVTVGASLSFQLF